MLVDVLIETYRRSPKRVAVEDLTGSLTYKQLGRLASVLRGIVLRETRCARVGIMLPASSAFPAVLFGTLWASKIAIPLNFLLSPDELAVVVEDADLDLIITMGHFKDLAARLPARTLLLEELGLKRKMAFAMLTPRPPPPKVQAEDTAVILYTSGTTGRPKGVQLSHRNLHSNCMDTIHSLNIDPPQTFLNILPPFHVFGLTGNVLVPVALGATVQAIPRFSPVAVVKTVASKGVSMMMAIPSMYAAILRSKSTAPDTFRSIYLAVSGGEPLPDSVREGFEERFGLTLRQGYGLTETSPVVSLCTLTEHRAGTVGKPIRNAEIRIVDSVGQDLPVGEDGEILVRGPGVTKGYYKKPEESRRVIDGEGWFHTGDVGRLDDDGFLSITGRSKEMLIIGGENVFPREIEAVLETHEGVVQSAVIGIADDLRGEVPVAFVIPAKDASVTEPDLRNFAKQRLPTFKVPRRIEIRENLPTGPTGKILKRRLRELL